MDLHRGGSVPEFLRHLWLLEIFQVGGFEPNVPLLDAPMCFEALTRETLYLKFAARYGL